MPFLWLGHDGVRTIPSTPRDLQTKRASCTYQHRKYLRRSSNWHFGCNTKNNTIRKYKSPPAIRLAGTPRRGTGHILLSEREGWVFAWTIHCGVQIARRARPKSQSKNKPISRPTGILAIQTDPKQNQRWQGLISRHQNP